jgi:hypothetical protein
LPRRRCRGALAARSQARAPSIPVEAG